MSLHCREGSTLSAHENACVYFAFPASFFRPFKVYTNFTAEVYSYYYTVNNSSSVPINHGIAATLAYVNRKLINALVSLVSPRGPYGREEEHAMSYYSGGLGQRFLAIPSALDWTWLLEKKNASITARGSRVSISPRIPDEPTRPKSLVIAPPPFFSFFFFNLTYTRWTSSLPSCLWSLRIFPSLSGSRLTIFSRDASSALLQLVNQRLNYDLEFSRPGVCVRSNLDKTFVFHI